MIDKKRYLSWRDGYLPTDVIRTEEMMNVTEYLDRSWKTAIALKIG